jgi:hypothetical protein
MTGEIRCLGLAVVGADDLASEQKRLEAQGVTFARSAAKEPGFERGFE